MHSRLSPLVLATVLAATPGMASADATASLRLSQFGYSLIDLNPGDGIAPAVTFDARNFRAGVRVSAVEQPKDANGGPAPGTVARIEDWNSHFTLFPELGRAVSLPSASVSATLSGSVVEHSYGAVLEGRARNGQGDGLFLTDFRASAEPAIGGRLLRGVQALSLTPFTEMVWTGRLALDSETSRRLPGMRYQGAGALAEIRLLDLQDRVVDSFSAEVNAPRGSGRDAEDFDIRLRFTNFSDAAAHGYLTSDLRISGGTYLPVPETGTPWLMLGGLGWLAWVVRRRRPARGALPMLAALAGVLAGPAQADISARASVTNFGYTLVDLNPDDGIAPGIEFALRPGWGQSGSHTISEYYLRDARLDPNRAGVFGNDSKFDSTGPFVPLSTSISAPLVSASAFVGGSAADQRLAFSAQGRLEHAAANAGNWRGSGFLAEAEPSGHVGAGATEFRLTPFTQLTWHGDYALSVDTTVGRADASDEWVSSFVMLSMADAQNRSIGGFGRSLKLLQIEPGSRSDSGVIDVSFANTAATPFIGSFGMSVRAYGQVQETVPLGSTPPIPEPGTWALLLCGLGLVSAAARSRHGGAAG